MHKMTQLEYDLKKPFPANKVKWRQAFGKGNQGRMLAYIDARDVMQRLDEVMGMNWQCRYTQVGQHGTVCEIGLKIDGEWVWRADGAGETNIEAEKGGLSDAFKRAGVRWGIFRYAYGIKGNELPEWATPEGFEKLVEIVDE